MSTGSLDKISSCMLVSFRVRVRVSFRFSFKVRVKFRFSFRVRFRVWVRLEVTLFGEFFTENNVYGKGRIPLNGLGPDRTGLDPTRHIRACDQVSDKSGSYQIPLHGPDRPETVQLA